MGEAQELSRFGLDTHSSSTLVQSCRGTSIIKAGLCYSGVNKVSGYTRERESSENDPMAEDLRRKEYFFLWDFYYFLFLVRLRSRTAFSQCRGTGVPSPAGPGSTGEHGNEAETAFHSTGKLRFGLARSNGQRSIFVLSELVPLSEWQRGNNNVRYQIVVTGLSHLTCMTCFGDLKHVWFANDANSASLLFVSRVSADFAFSSENSYFVTHGCCLFPSPWYHNMINRTQQKEHKHAMCLQICTPGSILSQRQPPGKALSLFCN